ncbi:hypothetical protein GCM10027280_40020 [Micromonospora polyrhachis]|uniref:Broad specificity phosphatase PhoE n=1 Tax=Micromonospora polyrhachis TaxID=1282883 RepID=A0A7W7WMK5_9ACTN|nr:histidine phosphatase family protein [Micromonospora polyrhachis]MBB4956702.1 broad specificity phosphatase PhoE [Micromonospora polyrhachis]
MAVDIVFEPPAPTTDEEAGRISGWRSGVLSAYGRSRARQLGERHRADGITGVFCSDLDSVVQTVEIAFPHRGIPVHRDTRLRECDYGDFDGMPVAEFAPLRSRHLDQPFPRGQSYRQVVDQTRGFLRDLAAAWDGRRVLVVAHTANRWAFDHLLTGVPLENLLDAPLHWPERGQYRLPTGGIEHRH